MNIVLQVSNHQITMHLEGDMTVVGSLTVDGHLDPLEINYVTAVNPETSREQIVHYCESVKYESVTVKDEFQRLHERLSVEPASHVIENNVSYYSELRYRLLELYSQISPFRVVSTDTTF